MKNTIIVVIAAFAAGIAWAGSFEHGSCHAKWDDTVLTVGNGMFTRSYAVSEGLLRTVSFRTKGGCEWIREAVKGAKGGMTVSCSAEKRNPAGVEGLAVRVTVAGKTTVIRVYPEAAGITDLAFFRMHEYAPACLDAVFLSCETTKNPGER